jgi:beta-glucosidase
MNDGHARLAISLTYVFAPQRHFEVNGIRPRYAFGHGLSYTTFTYSDLRILMPEKPIDDGRHAKRPLQGLEADLPEHGEMATGHHAQIAFAASQNFSTSGDTAAFVRSIPPRRLQQQPDNLCEDLIEVTFSIATAGRNGHEVAQLYLSFPTNAEEPPKVLRGFERVWIQDGSSAQVKLPLRRKDISIW